MEFGKLSTRRLAIIIQDRDGQCELLNNLNLMFVSFKLLIEFLDYY